MGEIGMPRFPSWTWLPARYAGRDSVKEKPSGAPVSLPAVEQLDPRVLLSTSEVTISPLNIEKVVDKATPALALAAADIFIKLGDIKGESQDDKHRDEIAQLSEQVLKLNFIFQKYHEDILNVKLSPTEGSDVVQKLNDVFVKIDFLAADLDGGSQKILPAVQRLKSIALGGGVAKGDLGGLLGDLSALAAGNIKLIPADQRSLFVKLNDEFWKLGEVAIDYEMDLIRGVPMDVAQQIADKKVADEYLKIKLDDVLISSFLSEKDQSDFGDIIKGAVDGVNNVIHPAPPPVLEITFTGGVTTPVGDGDTID